MISEPTSFSVGETVEWQRYLNKYPAAEGWNLSYNFRNYTTSFDVAAIAEADYYLVLLDSETTTAYLAGNYWWQATIHKENLRYMIAKGNLEIKPNLALLATYDGRSHVKKVLDALEATIVGKASRDQLSYSISGRSLSRLSPAELLKWRDIYKDEYARNLQEERIKNGLSSGNLIKVRFNNS
ncbi:hypothetical protein [Candidatus Tisiphia endosymbiont of Myopa tessellatipennis]|uniref:hypothetical protein n=1 Tax=Candidatus Tisiphia endosymbiont of Myopa tessellatipennis TaxID=3066257 RepID=UPI00313EA9D8